MALGRKTGGRKKGTLNKSTLEFKERLKALNCDPQEFLAKVLTGEERSLGAHPFYDVIMNLDKALGEVARYPSKEQWKKLIEQAEALLKYTEAGLELRCRIATDLLPYIMPKLKQVELSGTVNNPDNDALVLGAKAILAAKLGALPSRRTIELEAETVEAEVIS